MLSADLSVPTAGALTLDKVLQPAKRCIPLRRDRLQMLACFAEALLFQLPNALAAAPGPAHETCLSHDAKVFADRLTCHGEPHRQLNDRQWSVVAQAGDQAQP